MTQEYIITEELLIELGSPLTNPGRKIEIKEIVRSRPVSAVPEREKVLDGLKKEKCRIEPLRDRKENYRCR